MKVHDQVQSQLANLQRANRPDATGAGARPPGTRRSATGTDRVQLSELAGQMQAAAIVDDARHAERLAELRALIEAGRYQVDPEKVAEAIVHEEIHPWTAR